MDGLKEKRQFAELALKIFNRTKALHLADGDSETLAHLRATNDLFKMGLNIGVVTDIMVGEGFLRSTEPEFAKRAVAFEVQNFIDLYDIGDTKMSYLVVTPFSSLSIEDMEPTKISSIPEIAIKSPALASSISKALQREQERLQDNFISKELNGFIIEQSFRGIKKDRINSLEEKVSVSQEENISNTLKI